MTSVADTALNHSHTHSLTHSLIVNWSLIGWGGGDARHRCSVDLDGSRGMLLQNFVFINLIEYGVSFGILKYKSLSLYL